MKIFDKKGISLLATLVFVAMLSVACSGGGGDDGDSLPDGGGGGDTTPDTTAPQLSSFSPADSGQINVATHSVSVTFDEAIDPLTVTGSSFWVESGTSCSDSSAAIEAITPDTSDNKTFTLSFSADWTDAQSYTTCVTTDIKDSAGNALEAAQSATWSATSADIFPIYLSKFQADYSGYKTEGGQSWVEIKVSDASSIASSDWKIYTANSNYSKTLMMDSTNVSQWTSLVNGDTIRIHSEKYGYTGDDNTSASTDGGDGKYDFVYDDYTPSNVCGVIWIEDGSGNVKDIIYYSIGGDTSTAVTSGSDGETALNGAISNSEWPDASTIFDYDSSSSYAVLSDINSEGDDASDWTAQTDFDVISATAIDATTIEVVFSEAPNTTLAETTGNYAIDNGLNVTNASLSGNVVTLTTGSQTPSTNYTVTVTNVTSVTDSKTLEVTSVSFTGYNAAGTLFLDETFNYGSVSGDLTDVGGGGDDLSGGNWVNYSSTSEPVQYDHLNNLTLSGYTTAADGSMALAAVAGEDPYRTFSATGVSTGKVYASALINLTSAGTTGGYFLILGDGTSFKARLWAKDVSGSGFNLGATGGSTASYGSTLFTYGTTYLVIMKADLDTGDLTLFVLTASSASEPGTFETTDTGLSFGTLDNIIYRQDSTSESPAGTLDALKIADKWVALFP